jgi:histidyl-tRNA synthetase
VRGLDYYTRTTFEFTHGGLGAQNALLGGGRYDGLSEAIGGPKAPGIGFAMGEDRLVLTLQALETAPVHEKAAPLLRRCGDGLNERRRAGPGARTAPRRPARRTGRRQLPAEEIV